MLHRSMIFLASSSILRVGIEEHRSIHQPETFLLFARVGCNNLLAKSMILRICEIIECAQRRGGPCESAGGLAMTHDLDRLARSKGKPANLKRMLKERYFSKYDQEVT